MKEISNYKHKNINLTDSFELEFKIVENDNDTSWVQNLANVGSDGTDILVKAMINIMLLNVFKEGATKNRFKDFRLHCMIDEIDKLHPENVRGILYRPGKRNSIIQLVDHEQLGLYLKNQFSIRDLNAYIDVLRKESLIRADLTAVATDSKLRAIRRC